MKKILVAAVVSILIIFAVIQLVAAIASPKIAEFVTRLIVAGAIGFFLVNRLQKRNRKRHSDDDPSE